MKERKDKREKDKREKDKREKEKKETLILHSTERVGIVLYDSMDNCSANSLKKRIV